MLGHSSAAMTLDVYADLFDDDLAAVADRLDHGLAQTSVGKMWARPVSKPPVAEESSPSSGIYPSRESGPRGARTHDPGIKSPLLYRLS